MMNDIERNSVIKDELSGETMPQVSRKTRVMGILNVTPDSFSDGSLYLDPDKAAEYAFRMAQDGADIIDIGGESSRPGSESISADEEIKRVLPVVSRLKEKVSVTVSVDTYKSEVADRVLSEGAGYINDITALNGDPLMAKTISSYNAGVILMHMKGTPKNMQDKPEYEDIIDEILSFLTESVSKAERAGIDPDKIIVDPGIGFGKTVDHNLTILKNIHEFKVLGKPVLVGLSRKSFIGTITGRSVDQRIYGTAAGVAVSVAKGADIVRVHDVEQMKDVVKIIDAVMGK